MIDPVNANNGKTLIMNCAILSVVFGTTRWKADNFACYDCVPTFMLNRMDLPTSERKAV
jgi:hypothetical protein